MTFKMKLLLFGNFMVTGALATAGKCSEDNGNWYCSPVQRISYKGVGTEGSYDRVVGMDAATGQCQFEKQHFSGPLAPLDEDVSDASAYLKNGILAILIMVL